MYMNTHVNHSHAYTERYILFREAKLIRDIYHLFVYFLSAFHHYDETLRQTTHKEEMTLAHSFRGFNP